MRKLLFSLFFVTITFVANAQHPVNITSTRLYIPIDTVGVGEFFEVATSMNVSNFNSPDALCLFEFMYAVGGVGNFTSPQQSFLIPGNTSTEFGPTGFINLTYGMEGITNVTVNVTPIGNCTDALDGSRSFDLARIIVLAGVPIPTLGQWGMIILGFLVLIVGVVDTKRQKQAKQIVS